MTCEDAIEKIKSGEITCRDRDMTGELLALLASVVDAKDSCVHVTKKDIDDSIEWYMERNRKLAEIIIRYMKFCKKLRSSIVPTEDIFSDFKIDTKKIIESWKQIPSMSEIDSDILQTLKDIVEVQK